MSPIYSVKRSEDEIGEKYDRCLTETVTKTGAGIGVGIIASLVAFKRKTWPIAFGTGVGLGMAMANCQMEFRNIYPKQKPLSIVNDILSQETNTTVSVVVPAIDEGVPVSPVEEATSTE